MAAKNVQSVVFCGPGVPLKFVCDGPRTHFVAGVRRDHGDGGAAIQQAPDAPRGHRAGADYDDRAVLKL